MSCLRLLVDEPRDSVGDRSEATSTILHGAGSTLSAHSSRHAHLFSSTCQSHDTLCEASKAPQARAKLLESSELCEATRFNRFLCCGSARLSAEGWHADPESVTSRPEADKRLSSQLHTWSVTVWLQNVLWPWQTRQSLLSHLGYAAGRPLTCKAVSNISYNIRQPCHAKAPGTGARKASEQYTHLREPLNESALLIGCIHFSDQRRTCRSTVPVMQLHT